MLGLGSLARKVFGTPNDRKVKSISPLVEQINALEPEYMALSDDGIIAKTHELQKRVQEGGESLDAVLPEAFALTREMLAEPASLLDTVTSPITTPVERRGAPR